MCRCAFSWCAGQSPAAGTAQPHSSSGERGAGDGEGAAEEAGRVLMAAHGEERLHMQLPPNRSSLCGVGQPERESGKKRRALPQFLTQDTFPMTVGNTPSRAAGLSSQTWRMKAGRCEHGQLSSRLCRHWD